MNYLKTSPLLALLMFSVCYAQTPFNLELKANSHNECEPLNPNSNNQFACCVQQAQRIELDQQNVLRLKADPNLCRNPLLQDMKFTLINARPNGIHVYELSSPNIEQTPFKSYSGHPTRFWIATNSYFVFPKKIYSNNGLQPFIISPLAIEQKMPDGSLKVSFRGELSTTLGWKYLSEVTLSNQVETYDCSNQFEPYKVCSVRVRLVEQTWLNQLTNELFKHNVSYSDSI